MHLRAREREREGKLLSRMCVLPLIKIEGDAPCAPIYSVKVSDLGGGRMYARENEGGRTIKSFYYLNWVLRVGTCNQFFFFSFLFEAASLRVSSRPRDLTEMNIREEAFSLVAGSRMTYQRTFLFSRNRWIRLNATCFSRFYSYSNFSAVYLFFK